MQRVDGRLVLSPTDLTKHVSCPHITTLDLRRLDGEPGLEPAAPDDALALVFTKGIEHEERHLAGLRERGLRVVEIDTSVGKQAAESATLAAMRGGADVVYQATLYDGAWVGHADFLLKTRRPSNLGEWSYDLADTKLARRLKVPALLQMATYAVRLADLQGAPPRQLVVVTGDRAEHPWRLVDVESYAARLRDRLVRAVHERPPTEPVPVAQCAQCRWLDTCAAEWRRRDDLSQVAGMRVDQRQALCDSGIRTMTQLAGMAADDLEGILSAATRQRLVAQARLQHHERISGGPAYELLDPEPGQGLARLPEPSPGDVYLDFEGDPWAEGGAGREYLAGLWERSGEFTAWWAHSAAEEKRLTGDLVDELIRRWQGDPQMHIYHYAAYEVTALKRLTGRHGTHEAELDQLLRSERFVDLYAVVRQGVRISKASYSIKKLEDFYWGRTRSAGTEQVTDAMTSIVDYERWLVDADQSTLDRILAYNREDCRSTHDLQAWLEDRRAELSGQGVEVPRPTPPEPKEVTDEERAEAALAERLLDAGHALLAGCVGWHRREARPAWWDYFHYSELDTEALIEDATAIGALGEPAARGAVKRSTVWRYPFPAQDCRPVVGDYAPDVDTHMNVGKVLGYDPVAGWVDLSIGNGRAPVVPRGLGVKPPIVDGVLRTSIARTAERVLDGQSPLG
ncbi:MAG TPA: TM0106 family RecB-like putative nuclease, partial [Candidatus Lustribacter sp.]|nr:TM0106 family RecB-like putative nuclease [Candidatus Lustribacter sp.]